MVKAVLLDIDGTLLDSNDAHARAWVEAGEEFGHDIGFEQARPLIGMGGDKVLPRLTGLEEESEEGAKLLDRRGEIFRERHLATCHPFPGVKELVERLRADGITVVAATSASDDDLEGLLERAGIDGMLDDAANADDAEESKPAPDIVEGALAKAGEAAESCVMIGDTPYDIEAAHRAGVRIIAVTCGGWSAEDLAEADEVYDGPAAILADYEELFGAAVTR